MFIYAKTFPLKSSCVAVMAALFITGCAQFPRPMAEPSIAVNTNGSIKAALEDNSTNSMDIDAGFRPEDIFMLRPINESGSVPNYQVRGVTITESGVFDALRLIAKDAGMALNIEGGINGSERFGSTSAFNVHGNLKDVLEELSHTMGFFYSVRNNTLFIQQDQQFVIELPPSLNEDNSADLTNTLQYLGAKDAYIDHMSRSLVFNTNRKSLVKIEGYLQNIRDTRSLIIYDINIFQVDLKDNSDTGIQWNKLGWNGTPVSSGAGGSTGGGVAAAIGNAVTATRSTLGMGLVLSGAKFSIDSLINFLQTQGSVKAISRPRLAMISGTKGMLRVGQVTTFISKVGTNFSTSLNQVTTETRDLKTGLELRLFGDLSDNTVYTRVGLMISEITRVDKVTALGTDFTLPQTADREINTTIRARPGDMILLGGITIEKDTVTTSGGISGTGKSKEVQRSELVLTLKAKVVHFYGKDRKTEEDNNNGQLIGVNLIDRKVPLSVQANVNAMIKSNDESMDIRQPLVLITSGSYNQKNSSVSR